MVALSYAERARLAQPTDDGEKFAQKQQNQNHNVIIDQTHSQPSTDPSTNPGSSATSTTGTLSSSPPLSAHPQLPTPNTPGLLSSPSSPVDSKHSIDTNHPRLHPIRDPSASLSQLKPNAWEARKQHQMTSVIPPQKQLNGYAQQPAMTRPTSPHHADHSRLPPPSSFSPSTNKHPDSDFSSSHHNSLPPLNDPENWPEMRTATSSHRSRQSVTSLPSITIVSGTQNQITSTSATQENSVHADELASVKKPKGEKTKWTPIPPEELQAAADAANQSHSHSNSSRTTSRQHSPHVNGRGMRRLPSEDFHPERSPTTKRLTNRAAPERAESVAPGGSGSRNAHSAGLDQGSAAPPPRVSPLRGASNLPRVPSSQSSPVEVRYPSQSSNIGQSNHQSLAGSAWPSRGRSYRGYYAQHSSHPSNHRPRYNNGAKEPAMSQAAVSGISSYPPSNASVIPPAQHPPVHGQPQSHPSYPQLFYFPHCPTYLPTYAQAPYPTQDAPNTYSIEDVQAPTRHREKRKRRPHPSEAASVAGYRSYYPEVLIVDPEQLESGSKFWVVVEDEETLMVLDEQKPARCISRRRAPWSIGVDDSLRAQRWPWSLGIVEESPVEGESAEKERTSTFGSVGGLATPPSLVALAADLKVRDAILSAVSPTNENNIQGSLGQAPHAAGWPVPGAGPSALDIGMAMGMGVIPHAGPHPVGLPAPPMLPLSMPSHSHPASHHSPSTAVPPNMDWAIRDDPFVVVQPPYHQQYRPYGGPVYQEMNTGGYGSGRGGRYDGEGSGWKSDRGYGNGEYRGFGRGRGRGFSRGRGFRGGFGGGYNRQYGGPPATAQSPPPPLPPNGPVIYIPEPIMPPPFAPYTPIMPNGYSGIYGAETPIGPVAVGANNANATGAPTRRPSPKPLSSIQFPLDAVRYKLLGQVEYYFSSDNLARDLYLRKHMDSQGWVSLDILQAFPRLKELQVSTEVIRETLFLSQYLEIRANYVRMVNDDWKVFVMPDAEESKVAAVDAGYHPPAAYSVPPSQPGVWYPQQQLQHPGYVVAGVIPPPYHPQSGYAPYVGYLPAQPYIPALSQDLGEDQPGSDSRVSGENEEGITSEEDEIEIVIAEANYNLQALRPTQQAIATPPSPLEPSAA